MQWSSLGSGNGVEPSSPLSGMGIQTTQDLHMVYRKFTAGGAFRHRGITDFRLPETLSAISRFVQIAFHSWLFL